MRRGSLGVSEILDQLEAFHGSQTPCWPTGAYHFLVWWHCGYPASDTACAKGWEALNNQVGVEPAQILAAGAARLARPLKAGGIVPELRAERLLQIAVRVQEEFGGDLRAGLAGPLVQVRRSLKRFPNIADPAVDRIFLFDGISPVAAVPSNCPHVLVRILQGLERESYGVTYREAQKAIESGVEANFDARTRAYLLLKQHGKTLCKRSRPKCDQCPLSASCAFAAGNLRGRATPA